MTDQFPAMTPMRKSCKQLQKVGQYLLKCYNHSLISITTFSHSDQNLVPTLSCHFFPVGKSSFGKALEHSEGGRGRGVGWWDWKSESTCYPIWYFELNIALRCQKYSKILLLFRLFNTRKLNLKLEEIKNWRDNQASKLNSRTEFLPAGTGFP